MRLLLDSCMSRRLAVRLRDAGHDVVSTDIWPIDPGDVAILERAFEDSRVLVTLDKGFGRLAFERRMPHAGIIWLRNVSPLSYFDLIQRAIDMYGPEFTGGAIVVIGLSGMRKRRSPFDDDA